MLSKQKNGDGTVDWLFTSNAEEPIQCVSCKKEIKKGALAMYCRAAGVFRCLDCDQVDFDVVHSIRYANKHGEHEHFRVAIYYEIKKEENETRKQ